MNMDMPFVSVYTMNVHFQTVNKCSLNKLESDRNSINCYGPPGSAGTARVPPHPRLVKGKGREGGVSEVTLTV